MSSDETSGNTGTEENDGDKISKDQLIETEEHRRAKSAVPLSVRVFWPIVNKRNPEKSLTGLDLINRLALDMAMRQTDIKVGLQMVWKFRRLKKNGKKGEFEDRGYDRICGHEADRRAAGSRGFKGILDTAGPMKVRAFAINQDGNLETPNQATLRLCEILKTDPNYKESADELSTALLATGAGKLTWFVEVESTVVFPHASFDERKDRVQQLFRKRRDDLTPAEQVLREIAVELLLTATITELYQIAWMAHRPTEKELEDDDVARDRRLLENRIIGLIDGFVDVQAARNLTHYVELKDKAERMSTPTNKVHPLEIDEETGEVERRDQAAKRLFMTALSHGNPMVRAAANSYKAQFEAVGLLKEQARDKARDELDVPPTGNSSGQETTGEPPPTDS